MKIEICNNTGISAVISIGLISLACSLSYGYHVETSHETAAIEAGLEEVIEMSPQGAVYVLWKYPVGTEGELE